MASPMRDDDGASPLDVDDEFLRYLSSASGDASRPTTGLSTSRPPPPSLPAPFPTLPPASAAAGATSTTTVETEKKAGSDPNDVATPPSPSVATDYYDAEDPRCPRPSAPPLEMLVEDGKFDDEYVISRSERMSHQMSHPPPPSSRGGPDKEGGGRVEDGAMRMAMGDGYYEERALPPPALPPPPPPPTVPIVATSIGSSGVRDARGVMGDDAEAAAPASRTIPLATAVPMTMTSLEYASSGLAQARYNVEGMAGGGGGGTGVGVGTNVALPDWLVRRMRFGMICLGVILSVVVAVIVAVAVLAVSPRPPPRPPVPVVDATTTSSTAIATTTSVSIQNH
jgi:hypothetical protein